MKHPALGLAVLAVALFLASTLPCSAVVYVKWDSPGPTFDGNSWDTAYHTVQEGIDTGSIRNEEVWVARGTYVGCIILLPNVALYGGFLGIEVNRTQRSIRANETVLDGNKAGSVVTVPSQASTGTLIDGFTIRNGTGTLYTNQLCGGGVFCRGLATISNNRIQGNTATDGGGIYGGDAILGNVIRDNVAGAGGGIYGGRTVANNFVYGNYAGSHSGIYSAWTVLNNTVVANGCETGGAISDYHTAANNIVAFNSSGIYVYQVSFPGDPPSTVSNCVYQNSAFNFSLRFPSWQSGMTANFSADPLLASTEYGDLHIQPDSPCLDAGDDSFVQTGWLDIDGQPRIRGAHVDVGADESYGIEWSITPRVIRVKPDGTDNNDGSSWDAAKRTVQSATDYASFLGGGEVWVKAGTYPEIINLRSNARLYGGFAGTETARAQRDWLTNETILDGEHESTVISAISVPGFGPSAVDGFTIRNGTSTHAGGGGGVYCQVSAPIINHCLITGNTATYGGGVYCKYSAPLISHNVISGNTASSGGGGVATEADHSFISRNRIQANSTAGTGGGIYCGYATWTEYSLINCNVISGNSAADSGGGIICTSESYARLINNTVVSNTAAQGAGVSLGDYTPIVENNIIAWCSSGMFYANPGYGTLIERNNCLYANPQNYVGLTGHSSDMLNRDPLFVDLTNGDYHLSANSPCINKGWRDAPGLPLYDLDGESRVYGSNVDIGADEYWPSALSLYNTKRASDGAVVGGTGAVISAVFPDHLYLESADRSLGIRVSKRQHGLAPGLSVTISGTLGTNADGERFIEASEIIPGAGASIRPLGIRTGYLGGMNMLYKPLFGSGQQGVREYRWVRDGETLTRMLLDAAGLNNIGLLVKVWGTVTYLGDTFFYLDDGGGLVDGTHRGDGSPCLGVRVSLEGQPMPELDSLVRVTGVSSCYKTGSDLFRLLRAVEIAPLGE